MTSYAVQDLRNLTREFIQVDTTDISDALLDSWMRDGFNRILLAERPWPFLEVGGVGLNAYSINTVVGQQLYQLPSLTVQGAQAKVRAKNILAVQGPHWELLYHSQTALESTFTPAFIVSQEPERYSLWGANGITLWPVPNAIYTLNIRAYRDPVDWIGLGAGGIIDAPDDFHPVLLNFMLARGWAQQTDLEQASYFEGQYQQGVQQLKESYIVAPLPENLSLNGGKVTRQLPPRLRFPFEGLNDIGIGQ